MTKQEKAKKIYREMFVEEDGYLNMPVETLLKEIEIYCFNEFIEGEEFAYVLSCIEDILKEKNNIDLF